MTVIRCRVLCYVVVCAVLSWLSPRVVSGQSTATDWVGNDGSHSDLMPDGADVTEMRSELEDMKMQIRLLIDLRQVASSELEDVKTQMTSLTSRLAEVSETVQQNKAALNQRIEALSSRFQTVQTQVTAVSSATVVRRCRVCFRETEGSSQCQRSRHSCSGWSSSPSWTSPFRDDTDRRGGGCTYQWRLECA